jgi:predicted O-methyltransferase YrrM
MFNTNVSDFFLALRAYYICPSAKTVFTHLTNKEKCMLYRLAFQCKSSETVAVEVGSYLGASSLFIASALNRSKYTSKLYCVDTWQNTAMSDGEQDTWIAFKRNTQNFKNIFPLRGTSVQVAAEFQNKIDFLFLDGDHSYEGVKTDVDSWLPKVKSGGVVAMHDIGWAEGVQQVVREDVLPRVVKSGRLPNLFWANVK